MSEPTEIDENAPMLTRSMKLAFGLLIASCVIHITEVRTVNGEVVSFFDGGAVFFGGGAVLLALSDIRSAMNKYTPRQVRMIRMMSIALISGLGISRVLYGLGLFI